MSEFEFPVIHITRIVEEDGEDYEEAVTPPVCDFCFDKRVRWIYPCERFAVVAAVEFASDGEFASCDFCSGNIEAQNDGRLAERIIRSWAAMDAAGVTVNLTKLPMERQMFAALTIVRAFNAHRAGPREAFG